MRHAPIPTLRCRRRAQAAALLLAICILKLAAQAQAQADGGGAAAAAAALPAGGHPAALIFARNGAAAASQELPPPLQPLAAAAAAPLANTSETFPMLVVFRPRYLAALRAMCIRNPLMHRLAARPLGLPFDCHMPGVCRRVYTSAVVGFAGDFTDAQLRRLQRCLPGAVWYRELDASVHKNEDTGMQRRAGPLEYADGGGAGRRLQQQEGGVVRDVQVGDAPSQVHSFEVSNRTRGGEGAAISVDRVSGGLSLGAAGEHRQPVPPQLWNLDRMDQREVPLDGKFIYGSATSSGTGAGVTVYVVDSGVKLSHQEFRAADGGAPRASYGFDFVDDDDTADDCDGHGTHVSATVAGLQVGVAKGAKVVAVRILDCSGSGTISNTVAALDWVAANARRPAVVTLSLGIQVGSWSRVLEDAVRSLINAYGITVVVAAGNSAVDACYVAPANVPEVITVAATDLATKYNGTAKGDRDTPYRWGNSGPCIDVFAPGVDVFSACGSDTRCDVVDDMSYTYASGTSMAAPHVAGVAAVYLQEHPNASPQEVSAAITGGATQGAIDTGGFKQGTTNRLLFSRLSGPGGVMASNGP